jgi:hypothetical protein
MAEKALTAVVQEADVRPHRPLICPTARVFFSDYLEWGLLDDLQPLFDCREPGRHRRAVQRRQPLRRQLAADAGRVSRLSGSCRAQHRRGERDGPDALGHAAPVEQTRPAVPNIRNASSSHWRAWLRAWLKPENRCLLPANSFAEYAPEPNPKTRKKDIVWSALNEG